MWRLVWSPVEYFGLMGSRQPRLMVACVPPVLCGVLEWCAAAIMADKTAPVIADLASRLGVMATGIPGAQLSVATTVTGYPIAFGLAVVALVCIDVLAVDSGRAARLVECAGVAFVAFVPTCLVLVWAAMAFEPAMLALPMHPTIAEVQQAAARYQEEMAGTPLVSLSRSLYLCSTVWFASLLGAALKAVSGVPVRTAVVAAVVLGLAFSGVGCFRPGVL